MWRLAGAVDYFERNEMTLRDRDFTLCNRLMQRDPKTGASLDYIDPTTGKAKCFPTSGSGASINLIGTGTRAGVGAPGAIGLQFNRWRPNPAVDTGFVGWEGVGGTGVNLDVRDSFDDRMLNRSLISPSKNLNLYAEGGYMLNALGNAEAYFETMYSRRESYQTGTRQFNPDYAVGSPLLPASLSWSRYGADEGMSPPGRRFPASHCRPEGRSDATGRLAIRRLSQLRPLRRRISPTTVPQEPPVRSPRCRGGTNWQVRLSRTLQEPGLRRRAGPLCGSAERQDAGRFPCLCLTRGRRPDDV